MHTQPTFVKVILDADRAVKMMEYNIYHHWVLEMTKQALLNIILNANQSMSAGGQLTVKAYRTNGYISIDVTDTGQGISPDRIDRLFDLFYSTKKDGTGLGLSIARRIANMHGGEIQVKSQENEGTTVSILLPITCHADT